MFRRKHEVDVHAFHGRDAPSAYTFVSATNNNNNIHKLILQLTHLQLTLHWAQIHKLFECLHFNMSHDKTTHISDNHIWAIQHLGPDILGRTRGWTEITLLQLCIYMGAYHKNCLFHKNICHTLTVHCTWAVYCPWVPTAHEHMQIRSARRWGIWFPVSYVGHLDTYSWTPEVGHPYIRSGTSGKVGERSLMPGTHLENDCSYKAGHILGWDQLFITEVHPGAGHVAHLLGHICGVGSQSPCSEMRTAIPII